MENEVSTDRDLGFKEKRGHGRLIIGVGLIVFASVVAALFWGILFPMIRATVPPAMSPSLSPEGRWMEAKKALRWGIWTHDSGIVVGRFGDESWVQGLVESMEDGSGYGCGGGHREAALEMITNRETPREVVPGAFWSTWWEEHQHLSQEDWIREGFEAEGIFLRHPPASDWDDAAQLLTVLGKTNEAFEGSGRPEPESYLGDFAFPEALRYNAYRWLRDSGFDPVDWMLEERRRPDGKERRGLREFRKFEKEFGAVISGRLGFALAKDPGANMPMPKILETGPRVVFSLVITFVMGAGIYLVVTRLRANGHVSGPGRMGEDSQ